ncbi:MAG TPA: MgtC/SapB family protein [Chloroflexia bacterium]|jgi:putative Mg2+ transporter-C (MgtC) family protein|nr:MgtC/SapB family protein [Chloroflexia bacterium]
MPRLEEILLRLMLAAVLGSVVGIERERLDWAAGLRTHMLVCLGSTLFMLVSAFGFADILGTPGIGLDPSRIAAQVVSGVGFLGAGTIILRREAVRGLTTAASVWTVAAVGLAVGGGLYFAAISATVLILVILAGIKPLERRLFPKRRAPRIFLTVDRRETSLVAVMTEVEAAGLRVLQVVTEREDAPHRDRIQLFLPRSPEPALIALVDRLRAIPGVYKIDYPRYLER